jgi:hypothetical protein
MNHQLITGLFCLLCNLAIAQTKKIAFKSHSGSAEYFAVAAETNLFDMEDADFGVLPQRDVKNALLDSVIFVSDSVAIMITSEYCRRSDFNNRPVNAYRLWKSGREVVYSHPLFSRNHSLDSIRQVIQSQYNFKNPADKIVFVGYDNKKRKYKCNELIPAGNNTGNKNPTPFDGPFKLIFTLIMVTSGSAGFITWRWYKVNEQGLAIVPV